MEGIKFYRDENQASKLLNIKTLVKMLTCHIATDRQTDIYFCITLHGYIDSYM